jgi:hypothetical protein
VVHIRRQSTLDFHWRFRLSDCAPSEHGAAEADRSVVETVRYSCVLGVRTFVEPTFNFALDTIPFSINSCWIWT